MSELLQQSLTAHFRLVEVVCPCCQAVRLTALFDAHMEHLQALRNRLEFPLRITSAYRCLAHNRAIKGAPRSLHKEFATDVQPWCPPGPTFERQLHFLRDTVADMTWDGVGLYNSFVHLDCRTILGRPSAHWDERT